VDTLIWALVFVNVVGLGPFAGILAIVVSDLGTFAKLFAEAIENIDRKQVEGVRSTGASEIEVMRFGILPQVIPVILSQVLYYFESNTRSATILGIVGAGGIGLQLSDRIRVNNWDEACLIIIMILITVSIIDHLSKLARLRIIQAQEYRP
jgi:phosphonate transport system permease protein